MHPWDPDANYQYRFGNFIGEAVESDEEELQQDQTGADAYVDYEEEADDGGAGQELMEIDGRAL